MVLSSKMCLKLCLVFDIHFKRYIEPVSSIADKKIIAIGRVHFDLKGAGRVHLIMNAIAWCWLDETPLLRKRVAIKNCPQGAGWTADRPFGCYKCQSPVVKNLFLSSGVSIKCTCGT